MSVLIKMDRTAFLQIIKNRAVCNGAEKNNPGIQSENRPHTVTSFSIGRR